MFEINEWLEWLVSEIQHVSIYIQLQTMTCMRRGSNIRVAYPVNLFSQQKCPSPKDKPKAFLSGTYDMIMIGT